ncbi:MAG: universal stress protein [Halieaceae bacterium]|jgi:universal stress protein A|nr:universal stress protein [Halieaceae bacterium]
MSYKRVLVAVDLGETSEKVVSRASALAQSNDAQVHIVHVVEPLSITYGGDIPMDFSSIQDEIHQQAAEQLKKLAAAHGVPEDRQHIVVGRPETEIPEKAKEMSADLICVGSHARWGLALLLGSTADGILHGAECDVLAVRVELSD